MLLELLPLYRGEVDWVVVETLLNVFTKLESLTQVDFRIRVSRIQVLDQDPV